MQFVLVSLLFGVSVIHFTSGQVPTVPHGGNRNQVPYPNQRFESPAVAPLVRTPVNRILPSPSPGTKRHYAVEKNPETGKYELVITDRSLKPFQDRQHAQNDVPAPGVKGNVNSPQDGRAINIIDPKTGRVLGKLSYEGASTDHNGVNAGTQGVNRRPFVNIKVVDDYNITADPPALPQPRQMFAQEFVQDNKHNTRVRIDPSNSGMEQPILQQAIPTSNGPAINLADLKSSLPLDDIFAQMENRHMTGNTNTRNAGPSPVSPTRNQHILIPISQLQGVVGSSNNNRRVQSNAINMNNIMQWMNQNAGAIRKAIGLDGGSSNDNVHNNNRGIQNAWRQRQSGNFVRNSNGIDTRGRSGFQSTNMFSRPNNMRTFGQTNNRVFHRPPFSRIPPTVIARQQALTRPSIQLKGFSFT